MEIIIWGVGLRGKRIYSKLQKEDVVAFIDSDVTKVGEEYDGKKIIDLEEYIEKYLDYFILITPKKSKEIKKQLQDKQITQYLDLAECPIEWQYEKDNVFVEKYLKRCACGNNLGIYGTSFYSIYFYEKMIKYGCSDIYMIPEKNAEINKIEKIENAFKFIKILKDSHVSEFVNKVYITVYKENIEEIFNEGIEMENAFLLKDQMPEYWNTSLKKFKNKHYGERCFIVATGPSLTMKDLDTIYIHGEDSIGMNRVYLAFETSQWRPDYYVIGDPNCMQEFGDDIKSLPVKSIFVADRESNFWKGEIPNNIYKFHNCFCNDYRDKVEFSDDIVKCMYNSGTVTYMCIQLAVYLGYKEIFLIGVDFNIKNNYNDVKNHFTVNYYNQNSKEGFFWREESLKGYETAREYADTHGIKIYNATRGGELEVFERVDFDSLF